MPRGDCTERAAQHLAVDPVEHFGRGLVQNRTVRCTTEMPRQQNQRGGKLMDRVRRQTERRALEQAKRVPWKRLAAAADEYTEWAVFSLWLRAVVEAAKSVPAVVVQEMKSKAPQLVGLIRSDVQAAVTNGSGAGAQIWHHVSQWTEVNVFASAKREGWLAAIQYFSSVTLRSMQAWSHWEQTDEQWRVATPKQFPTYSQWKREVAAVTRLSNPDGTAQHVLESTRGVSEAEWTSLLSGFSELISFSLWMELMLDMEPPEAGLVSKELAARYSGFKLRDSAIGSKETVRSLNEWAIEHALGIASQEHVLAALSFHVTNHPAYYALRSYALHCHNVWPDECVAHPPSYVEWREAADSYFETYGSRDRIPRAQH
jgi:hypothetical protein